MSGRRFVDVETSVLALGHEISRWNRQINLVSRVDTPARIENLQRQCQEGWRLVRGVIGAQPWGDFLGYADVGSGAGLPGLIWAAELAALGGRAPTVLVEPREKRAWFLRRAARAMGLGEVRVLCERWGEGVVPILAGEAGLLISLKALRLTDGELLAGVDRGFVEFPGTARIVVARFLESSELRQEVVEDMFVLPAGGADTAWRLMGAQRLGEGAPSLLLSMYSQ
jgi:hypothetical protein